MAIFHLILCWNNFDADFLKKHCGIRKHFLLPLFYCDSFHLMLLNLFSEVFIFEKECSNVLLSIAQCVQKVMNNESNKHLSEWAALCALLLTSCQTSAVDCLIYYFFRSQIKKVFVSVIFFTRSLTVFTNDIDFLCLNT